MKIKGFCNFYFNAFSILNTKNTLPKDKLLAKVCIASYFFILPPIIIGIGYVFSRISQNHSQTTKKTHEKFTEIIHSSSITYPVVSEKLSPDFFVDVLNKRGYLIQDKRVSIPPAGKPRKFERTALGFEKDLNILKHDYQINDTTKVVYQFKDQSTEQAIQESTNERIALNFANENWIGGGPGFHKDQQTNLFIYDSASAKAQEESLCQRSDLMASLTQLPHSLEANSGFRSKYESSLNSTTAAYVSINSLFAVQKNNSEFYASNYLEEPKAVAFVTRAAQCYARTANLDCSMGSEAYEDAKQRITTHLLAAASQAGLSKREKPDQRTELILGAFGCGAFAPHGNPDDYRKMIANLYKELLPKFEGFFDVVTFAVPTFGSTDPANSAVVNYRIFKQELNF